MIIINVLNVKENSFLKPIKTVFVILMETNNVNKIKMPYILDIHQKMMIKRHNKKIIVLNLLKMMRMKKILHLKKQHNLQFHNALKEFYIAKNKKATSVINVVLDIHGIK